MTGMKSKHDTLQTPIVREVVLHMSQSGVARWCLHYARHYPESDDAIYYARMMVLSLGGLDD